MRDLLPNNMALAEKLEAVPVRPGQTPKGAEQREVGSLMTWVSSFVTYIAVLSEAQHEKVVDMLAYLRLIIQVAPQAWRKWLADLRCSLLTQPTGGFQATECAGPLSAAAMTIDTMQMGKLMCTDYTSLHYTLPHSTLESQPTASNYTRQPSGRSNRLW